MAVNRQSRVSSAIEGASKGNPLLKEILEGVMKWQSNFTLITGIDPNANQQTGNVNTLTPPPIVSSVSVVGVDNRFLVDITPPSGVTATIYYQVQSSLTTPFDTSISLRTYGPSPETHLDLTADTPGEVRSFRVRGKYANSDFGSVYIVAPVSSSGAPVGTASPLITRGFLFTPSSIILDGFSYS